jgi:hypothetical protein
MWSSVAAEEDEHRAMNQLIGLLDAQMAEICDKSNVVTPWKGRLKIKRTAP